MSHSGGSHICYRLYGTQPRIMSHICYRLYVTHPRIMVNAIPYRLYVTQPRIMYFGTKKQNDWQAILASNLVAVVQAIEQKVRTDHFFIGLLARQFLERAKD